MQNDSECMKSSCFNLGDGPANALALSPDYSKVVVAGRNVFKILSVDDDGFVEKANLRVGKNLNLNYSCNDVVWSNSDENLIATGATNGAVVLWNLSKVSRAKQEHVFTDHQRTVHKVLFHPSDPALLLSGSQDGTVKCFDIRLHEAKLTFKCNSESVRDIQFVPKNGFSFTSVSENGSVQIWDLRKGGERPFLTFTAHNGPVFSCDWHPEHSSVLATGGRDRAIKIWTISNVATLDHTIQTVASVGKIKWRPQRKHHIGSTSLVVDSSVCIWDYRRPFVPFATFEMHKDVATGIAWRNSPHILLSTSKDCMVWQNIFKDVSRPGSRSVPQALALNVRRGEIAHAQAVAPYESEGTTKFQIFNCKTAPLDEYFHLAQSNFYTFESSLKLNQFSVECAEGYVLNGRSAPEMCETNAQIALKLNIPQVSLVWEVCKVFCQMLTVEETPDSAKAVEVSTPPKEDQDDHGHLSDDDPNNSSSETEKQDLLADIASGLHMNQTLFMSPGPTYDFNYDMQQDWPVLPAEAFQPRHEIREGSSPPIHLEDCSPREMEEPLETVAIENRTSQLRITHMEPLPDFNFAGALTKMLLYHASKGDVQTAVSVWLVLQPLCRLDIPIRQLEAWCMAYVDLLQRHRLYSQSALVVKLSDSVIGQLSQESTSYLIACGTCGKNLRTRSGNFCDKCQKAVTRCVICGQKVAGLIAWCPGCGHGGHDAHLRWWFKEHKECPAGCGHLCYGLS